MSFYTDNILIHRDRRLAKNASSWVQQFSCEDLRPLIICRGPIRKETLDVFVEMGIENYGVLLSEKDSITYTNALAPELRMIKDSCAVHRVPDYSGATKEERQQRIQQIISIAHDNEYNSIFAGYGFMAEDEAMVAAMEQAGLNFIGPCSRTVREAGLKDEAKRTALSVGVSVTPGIDNATTLTLLNKHGDVAALKALVKQHDLNLQIDLSNADLTLEEKAEAVLEASYRAGIDLYSIDELAECIEHHVAEMFKEYPSNRLRLKAIGGGGGKGQRILPQPDAYSGSSTEKINKAAAKAPAMVREILNEVKATGEGDNKNVLIELNIETTRHQEIQVIGNGQWCMSLGGRDCSLQMHEQKLLEVSVIEEDLQQALRAAEEQDEPATAKVLKQDIKTLSAMEQEAATFGQAVGLDSVSTFECIVDRDKHFFMEMNTRIQVEHRVTELCYGLRFTNPDNENDSFTVESLVELMVLLACHGSKLPKPQRYVRHLAAVEARLNATNEALRPHAGGVINKWSEPIAGEIRDDQGICIRNPDTHMFIKYRLAGAYDSNIALILNVGENRLHSYQRMANILRSTDLQGNDLQTNLNFHYGLVNWFIGNNINARPTTRFIVPYLTLVGQLKEQVNQLDFDYLYNAFLSQKLSTLDDDTAQQVRTIIDKKRSLIMRPLKVLSAQAHQLAGWLSLYQKAFSIASKRQTIAINWHTNPLRVLADTYHYLNMDADCNAPAASVIWAHDQELLSSGLEFYDTLAQHLEVDNYADLCHQLEGQKPKSISARQWNAAQAAHMGYQLGLELLNVLPLLAQRVDFYDLHVNSDLTIHIPEKLQEQNLQEAMGKVLVPPPQASGNEILAASGGMFYSREAPDRPPFIEAGDHFAAGQPLYIVEVMKMFNKVNAPFAGTIEEVLVERDGEIISKGQALFKIKPDEAISIESQDDIQQRQSKYTDALVEALMQT